MKLPDKIHEGKTACPENSAQAVFICDPICFFKNCLCSRIGICAGLSIRAGNTIAGSSPARDIQAGVAEVGIRPRLKNGVLRVQVPSPVLLYMPGCMELGYRHGSDPCVRKDLRVQIPLRALHFIGRYANWQRQAVCKTVAFGLVGSNPTLPTICRSPSTGGGVVWKTSGR